MDVAKVSENGIKIKSKLALLAVTPFHAKPKVAADAVLLFDKVYKKDDLGVEDNPIVFVGPGEYEIKGVKLNGLGKTEPVVYSGKIDGVDVCISKASILATAKEMATDCQVVLLDADALLDPKILIGMNPNVVILYGPQAMDIAKTLGKEPQSMAKYTITRDKLPAEMEVIVLN